MQPAIYVRQSLDVAEGIARQVERCRSLVAARGWPAAVEYVDNDTSATKARGGGTAWARMLDDARAGRVDTVIAVNLDRLLRTQGDLLSLLDANVAVTTLEGELDLTSASGEMQASVLTAMARFEARRKSERQVRANDYRARTGNVVRGRRPFGYEADGMTVRDWEADAVRWGYQAMIDGASLADIARDWNGRGLTTGQGGKWSHDNVRHVLLNPRYRGAVRRHGEVVSETAVWPALVDVDVFRAVERILRDPARRTGVPQAKRLLSSIAECGVCGDGSKVHAGGGARRGVANYRCSSTNGHFARKAEPVEDHVAAVVCEYLANTKVGDIVAQGEAGDALAAEADELRSRLDSLALDFADGVLTSSQLRTASERLRARLSDVEDRLMVLTRANEFGDLLGRPDVRDAWDQLPLARKRRILRVLPLRVVIHAPGRGSRTFRPETVQVLPRAPRSD